MSPNLPPNSNETSIDYDPKTGRFIVSSPPWLLEKVRQIPNRRWDSRRRVWTAPALRANAEYILGAFQSRCFTDRASAAAQAALEKSRPVQGSMFPAGYTFRTTPRPYQREALDRAYDKNVFAYYMDMGTGKTKVSLDLLGALFLDQKVDRLLVVTKFSTRKNWEREVGIHLPFEADIMVLDTTKPKVFEKWNTAGDRFKILIVGTESLAAGSAVNYADAFLMVSTRAAMVVDEAHMIKNHSAVRSKTCVSLGRKAEYRFIMTGTPVANGPMDVFMQFEFLDPNIIGIGDFYSFRNRYAVMGGYEGKEIIGYQNLDELIELISPFIFQVRKSEVLTELPPKVFAVREVQMTDEQKRLYRQISKEDKAVSGDRGVTVKSVLERMLRLQEICGGIIAYERNPDLYNPDKYEHCRIPGKNPKVEELKAIIEETEGAVIVWCRFLEEIAMVSEALRETYGRRSVVEIHGGIGEQQRDDNVQAFQRGEARFLVGNAATGGVGLNMTRAETVIYFSNSFSFTDRDQSEDRAHRIGQMKSVTYIDLVCEGSVDEIVLDALRGKKDVSEYVRRSINDANEDILRRLLS